LRGRGRGVRGRARTQARNTADPATVAAQIALANNPATPLLQYADHPVLLNTWPEFLAGSTRMAAGTAQKIALNLLSTWRMTELGRVCQGHMVDMAPGSAKLLARARRMVAAIAGVLPERAAEVLQDAGGSVKAAVLVLDGLPRSEAEAKARSGRRTAGSRKKHPSRG
jgi:N-acetylmuramic acid 6-phosphate etherase